MYVTLHLVVCVVWVVRDYMFTCTTLASLMQASNGQCESFENKDDRICFCVRGLCGSGPQIMFWPSFYILC